ncbi:hypothetical protein [Proteiniphilum sp. UBA5384]|uniref:fimbrillin family protein n=1 Tax=Proteiniphilum sp. UBA5384 TaxID=1947279 RepID=UPI0025CF8382|nr:hypothetical protein [Proteiniphilum sp. UBA5384]
MKRIQYIYSAVVCALLVFAGCDKDAVDTPDTGEGEKVAITLSAPSQPVTVDIESVRVSPSRDMQTRAETINGRSIGVVAVNTDETTPLAAVDWSDYYLDHVRANGTNTPLNSEKEVVFATPQWWPYNPAEYLAFVAYSPHNGGDGRVTRVGTSNTLKVTANTTDAFPDFVYTEPVGPWNKETAKAAPDKAVSLGEFQHALAKLDIEVILVDKHGDPIPSAQFPNPNRLRITELKVSTEVKNGEFNLLASPKAWTALDATGSEQTVRTHISSSTTLTSDLPLYTGCMLLPGTEGKSYVTITVQELQPTESTAVTMVTRKAKISEFEVSAGVGAMLEMGKITKLTIKVKYVAIPTPPDPEDPDVELILEGQLVEWDYKGESTVTIE